MKKWFKLCPYCGTEIKSKAIKCQYCFKFLGEERKEKECPYCLNNIGINAKICPFCDEILVDDEVTIDNTENKEEKDTVEIKEKKMYNDKKKKREKQPKRNIKKEWLIWLIVLWCLFLIWFIFKYFEKNHDWYEPFHGNVKMVEDLDTSKIKTYSTNNNWIWKNVITYDSNTTSVTDMNWHKFEYWTISIWNITIMDRNLWAEYAWTWFWTFWYYYQRWNNYWFFWWLDPYVKTIDYQVNADSFWPWKYNNSSFVIWYESWDSSYNEDLRWNKTNTNIARQWPCPTWWHVPTMNEWQKLIDTWENLWNDISKEPLKFIDDFKLPLAWFYWYLSNTLLDNWEYWYYWTSSPYNWYEDYANVLRFYVKKSYYDGRLVWAEVQYENHIYRANWAQVRCFKN